MQHQGLVHLVHLVTDADAFQAWFAEAMPVMGEKGIRGYEEIWLDGLQGRELLNTWHDYYPAMAERFAAAFDARFI